MSGIKEGQFYIYRDEDGNAVAIAMMAKGPNGGCMGVDYARMGVPYGKTTREDINNRAEFMVSAMNTFGNTKSVIDAKDAEIERYRKALSEIIGYDRNFYDNGRPGYEAIARDALNGGSDA